MARKKIYQYEVDGTEEERKPSRSQKKRDSTALQDAGEGIAKLAPSRLALLPLNDDILAAIEEYRGFTSHEAKRRQLQFIGRLMREAANCAEIVEAYQQLMSGRR